MHSRYLQELMCTPVGDLTASVAHAKLKALQELQSDLESIENDEKFVGTRNLTR